MAEIEIVRIETIKPSSPTPDRLRKFGLSVFDQTVPDVYIQLLLFYPDSDQTTVSDRIRRLKLSLSEALIRFYPVAGRVVKDELHVDCDDGGVHFVEAKVNGCRLSDILGRPDDKVLRRLLPRCSVRNGVQVNALDCGATAIGVCLRHVIMDACAMSAFLKSWAAVARGDAGGPAPDLDVISSRFPAAPVATPTIEPGEAVECSTRRFLFQAAEIALLRKISARAGEERPTRVGAVSALVWKCIANALTKKLGHKTRRSVVSQLMNLRRRLEPPLPENSFGNMIIPVFAESGDLNELQSLAGQLSQGLRDGAHSYVTKFQDPEAAKTIICEGAKKVITLSAREDIEFYVFTSWCRYGWYELDFGWGRPAWISPMNPGMKNVVAMTDTRDGDGIEVLATWSKEDMMFFETDPELLEFASLDTSPYP